MLSILQRIRDAIDGKKTIITAIIGILTAALAWAAGELTDLQALGAVWVAIQIIFIRTGNKKDVSTQVADLNEHAAVAYYEVGIQHGSGPAYRLGYDRGWDDGYYEDEG